MADPTIVSKLKNGIASVESGGKYDAIGKTTESGDKAYGKYQVMGANIPSWTKEATGTAYTVDDFLKNPDIQEKVADHKIGQAYDKYGNASDVASVWFTGGPQKTGLGKKDLDGTTTSQYINKVLSSMDSSQPQQEIPQVGGSGLSLAARVKAKYPQYQNVPDADLEKKILMKYPQYASLTGKVPTAQNAGGFNPAPYTSGQVGSTPPNPQGEPGVIDSFKQGDYGTGLLKLGQAAGNVITLGGAGVLGNAIGTLGNVAYDKATGNDAAYNEDLQKAPTVKETGSAAVKTVVPLATAGLIHGVFSAAKTASLIEAAGDYLPVKESVFKAASSADKLGYLGDALKSATADGADTTEIEKAIEKLTKPGVISKAGGLVKFLAKQAAGTAVGAAFGDEAKNLYHYFTK